MQSTSLTTEPVAYQQTVINQLPTDKAIYLIIDGASTNALSLIYSINPQSQLEPLYHNTAFQELQDISPIIVRIDNNPTLQNAYPKWQQHSVAFSSTTDFQTTANHLKSLILCTMPNTQPAFFRFYAKTWLYPLLTEQTQAELTKFTGAIDTWYIPQPNKEWQLIAINNQGQPKPATEQAWFTLTQPLIDKLAEYNKQQYLEQLMESFNFTTLKQPEYDQAKQQLITYLTQATHYQITEKNHISHFIELALQFPKEITTPPIIQLLTNKEQPTHLKLDAVEQQLYRL